MALELKLDKVVYAYNFFLGKGDEADFASDYIASWILARFRNNKLANRSSVWNLRSY
jgi:hypothetical protein